MTPKEPSDFEKAQTRIAELEREIRAREVVLGKLSAIMLVDDEKLTHTTELLDKLNKEFDRLQEHVDQMAGMLRGGPAKNMELLESIRKERNDARARYVDANTKLEIALDALELSVGMNTMNEQARTNAIETLRGK